MGRPIKYTPEQEADLKFLLKNKYKGDEERLNAVWRAGKKALAESDEVPSIEELKADAYRQLKVSIVQTSDPQKLATTIKTLEDMKDRDAGRGLEEKVKGVAESVEALMAAAPPTTLADTLVAPVVPGHVKAPRKRKARPSKEVNGLDENSDCPREGMGGAEGEEAGLEEGMPQEPGTSGEDKRQAEEDFRAEAEAQTP